jgi:hypothetical protein
LLSSSQSKYYLKEKKSSERDERPALLQIANPEMFEEKERRRSDSDDPLQRAQDNLANVYHITALPHLSFSESQTFGPPISNCFGHKRVSKRPRQLIQPAADVCRRSRQNISKTK